MDKYFVEPMRKTIIVDHAQVLVVGGGLAGVSAAVTAKKLGLEVILVEQNGYMGGIGTAGLLGTFCGFYTVDIDGKLIDVVKGFGNELLGRLHDVGGAGKPYIVFGKSGIVSYDSLSLRLILDDIYRYYQFRVYLHSYAVSVQKTGEKIDGVVFESKAGRFAISGDLIIDATGDGDVAFHAGAQYEISDRTQFPTTIFCLNNVSKNISLLDRDRIWDLMKRAAYEKDFELPRTDGVFSVTPKTGEIRCNMTKIHINGKPINALDVNELTIGEIEGRLQVVNYHKFLKSRVKGFENSYISQLPEKTGVRETRRIVGEYMLTEEDVLLATKFEDAVGCNAWPVEMHGHGNKTTWNWLKPGDYYNIPYRCLVAKDFQNLAVVGRCMSTTQGAQASTRVMASCINQGEAAAVAAYHSIKGKIGLPYSNIIDIQNTLTDLGIILNL